MLYEVITGIPFVVANTAAFASNVYYTAQNGNWNLGTTRITSYNVCYTKLLRKILFVINLICISS